ncbi:MAG: flagellar motor protein MotA [Acidobacteria bacterium]|nr:MAG: flagellar motor protein MotA [Acidobacteriota bacterium]
MSGVARSVVVLLGVMSAYSISVMIERWVTYRQARRQSRAFAPAVAEYLMEGKVDEGIALSPEIPEKTIEAARRALERATAIGVEDLKRGLGGLATIGSVAPFVGLFGTTIGIINAFQGMRIKNVVGIEAVAGGIAEALVTTAFGLFVAVPAVMAFNAFSNRIETLTVEMDNSASELLDYFIERRKGIPR